MPGSLPVMSSAPASTTYSTLAEVPKNFGSANRTPPEKAAWSKALKPCFSPTSRRAERASRSTDALFSRIVDVAGEARLRQTAPRLAVGVERRGLDGARDRLRASAGSVNWTASRAVSPVGVEPSAASVMSIVPAVIWRAGRSSFARDLMDASPPIDRALEGLAVGRVRQRDVLPAEPLEAAGRGRGAGDLRVAVQLEGLHPLFVRREMRRSRCRR